LLLLGVAQLSAGTLSGRIVDGEGKPIAGARVVWSRPESDEEALLVATNGSAPETLGETRSDEQGRFRIDLEKPGLSIAVRIAPAGLPEARLLGPWESSETTTLEEIRFPPVSKLSGKVTDEKGKPVAGARVEVRLNEDTVLEIGFVAQARTGADGFWEMVAVPDGARSLTVRAEGFAPQDRPLFRRSPSQTATLKPGGILGGSVLDAAGKPVAGAIVVAGLQAARTDAAGAYRMTGVPTGLQQIETQWKEDFFASRQVKLVAGTEASANLKLVRAAAITGTVVDESTRRPIAGASIEVGRPAFGEGIPARRARTDARGRFRAGGLAPRAYAVEVGRAGYLPSELPRVVASIPPGPPLSVALRREASIAGTVVDDKGKPVAGARVTIPRDFGSRRQMRGALGRSFFSQPETLSAANGAFALRKLGASTGVTVQAAKTGYVPGRRTGVRLKAGEAVTGVSLVLRQGLQAEGRVVDAEGKPIAGAQIRATRTEKGRRNFAFFRAGAPSEKPDAVSDGQGQFRLTGLEAGRYQVAAEKEELVQKVPATLDVAEGAENKIAPIVLEAGAAVAGVVRNTKGEPLPAVQVFVVGEGGGGPNEGSTDALGKFRIAGLPAGRPVMLVLTADGFAPKQTNATPPAEGLAFTLDTSATVRGRVEDAVTKAPIPDFSVSRGEPAAGGGGIVMRLGFGNEGRSFHSEDGSFELPDVPPGKWSIRAEAAGYRPADVSAVELAPGEVKEGIVLSLKVGGKLSGRVIDAARGNGIANASVSWRPSSTGGPAGFILGAGSDRQVSTDADGKFSLEGLPEGKVHLEASHPDYLEASLDVDPDQQTTAEISLGSGATISGSVVTSDGRTPAPGARVGLDARGEAGRFGSESATADGSGAFLFEHLKAGRYQLTAQGNAGTAAPREITLTDGQRMDGVLLQIAGGVLLRGTVSGLPAEKLGGLRIFASSSAYADSATTDEQGHFTIPDVPTGVLRLTASTSFVPGRTAQANVEVPDGAAEVPVEIVFEGASRLSGQVTRAGKPLAGLFVWANPDPGGGINRSSAQTDDSGRYALEGLSDGPYRVSVDGPGVSYTKTLDVSGDTQGDLTLPATTLSGVVTDESSGQPLEGADVQAETGEETQAFAVKRSATDSNGNYSIADMDAGTYRVTARLTGYRLKTQSATVGTDPATLDFALAKGSGLSIRVSDGQTGIPLSSVQVLAFTSDGTVAFQGRVTLDATGAGEVPSLSDGTYAIYAFSDGYATRSLPTVNVPSPALAIAMTPGGRVEVRASAPLSGRLLDASGSIVLLTPWRLDGSLSATPPVTVWEHLAPGAYRLMVSDGGGESAHPFNVTEGQTTQLEIR
jgi:protocatechuate 3,4-dioxygenase beta subunit